MRKLVCLLAVVISATSIIGCGADAPTSNKDVAAAASSMDASKKGVVAQPDTDLAVAAGAGSAPKPGKK